MVAPTPLFLVAPVHRPRSCYSSCFFAILKALRLRYSGANQQQRDIHRVSRIIAGPLEFEKNLENNVVYFFLSVLRPYPRLLKILGELAQFIEVPLPRTE